MFIDRMELKEGNSDMSIRSDEELKCDRKWKWSEGSRVLIIKRNINNITTYGRIILNVWLVALGRFRVPVEKASNWVDNYYFGTF